MAENDLKEEGDRDRQANPNESKGKEMKEGIHPKYEKTAITCACGNALEIRSTKADVKVEICSACHPFFTGKSKIADAKGRIESFKKKYERVMPAKK